MLIGSKIEVQHGLTYDQFQQLITFSSPSYLVLLDLHTALAFDAVCKHWHLNMALLKGRSDSTWCSLLLLGAGLGQLVRHEVHAMCVEEGCKLTAIGQHALHGVQLSEELVTRRRVWNIPKRTGVAAALLLLNAPLVQLHSSCCCS